MPETRVDKNGNIACKVINCPICETQNERTVAEKVNGTYRLVKCNSCGLIYTNPMPYLGTHEVGQVYDGWDYHNKFITDLNHTLVLARAEFRRHYKFLRKRKLIPRQGNILDIGCGVGHILAAAKEAGWNGYGLDIDEESFAITKKAWNLDIRPVFLKDAVFEENYFHWIRARYLLEHVQEPNDLLGDIYKVLAPGGIVMIDVPNHEGFAAQLRVRKGISKGMGQIYGYLDPPIHVFGYSPRTMAKLIRKNGFEVPFSFTSFPGSRTWRPECAPEGIKRSPYIVIHWALSMLGKGSISVTCGRKPFS